MSYIERKAAIGSLMEILDRPKHAEFLYTDEICGALQSIPAADVRPVVHGENIGIEYDACDQFVCSKCGIELQDWRRVERDEDDEDVTYHEYVFNFCPHCGADMRKSLEKVEGTGKNSLEKV